MTVSSWDLSGPRPQWRKGGGVDEGHCSSAIGFCFCMSLWLSLSLSLYMTVNMYVYVCRERKVRVCERERSDFLRLVALSISLSVL